MTCGKAQGFLAHNKVAVGESENARRAPRGLAEARALLEGVDEVVSCRGKKVERLDLRGGPPDDATLARLVIGPSGKLRAPTARVGRTLLVGFDEDAYGEAFGK